AEAALGLTGLGEIEKLFLGLLDLLHRQPVEIVLIGLVDHILADGDELAAQEEVVDGAAVILSNDDRDHRGGEANEVLRAADFLQRIGLLEKIFQRHRIGELAALHQLVDGGIDAAMDAQREMLRPQEFGDAMVSGIIDEDRREQRLLGLDIGRRLSIGRLALAQRRDVRGKSGGFHPTMLASAVRYGMMKRYPPLWITGASREEATQTTPSSSS